MHLQRKLSWYTINRQQPGKTQTNNSNCIFWCQLLIQRCKSFLISLMDKRICGLIQQNLNNSYHHFSITRHHKAVPGLDTRKVKVVNKITTSHQRIQSRQSHVFCNSQMTTMDQHLIVSITILSRISQRQIGLHLSLIQILLVAYHMLKNNIKHLKICILGK